MNFKAFSIEEIKVLPSGDQATVKVRMDFPYMGYTFKGVSQMQTWVKEKGEWFVNSELPTGATKIIYPAYPAGKAEITDFYIINRSFRGRSESRS